jgi:hypothetical protein
MTPGYRMISVVKQSRYVCNEATTSEVAGTIQIDLLLSSRHLGHIVDLQDRGQAVKNAFLVGDTRTA